MPERRVWREGDGKRQDLSIIIPAFGIVLLMPLLVNLFIVRVRVFGIPLEIVYLFGVWLFLVGAAVALARLLPPAGPSSSTGADDKHVRAKRTGVT